MRFKVGPWLYHVRISDEQLHDDRGTAVDGLCCWSDRTIWISGTLALEQRLDTLMHELSHAWEQSFGIPGDSEGHANQNSSFAVDAWNQLNRMGGPWALARLRSDGVVDQAAADVPNTSYAVTCGECGEMLAMGSVDTSPPAFNTEFGCVAVSRSFTCETCRARTDWTEGVTVAGKPNGKVLESRIVAAVEHVG